jgi:FHA domain
LELRSFVVQPSVPAPPVQPSPVQPSPVQPSPAQPVLATRESAHVQRSEGMLNNAVAGSAPPAALFPPTGAVPERAEPPPNPFGLAGAKLFGVEGEYAVRPGVRLSFGRDPNQCQVVLSDPRVSALHAHVKFEGTQLLVMDLGSNNGTFIDGVRQSERAWNNVPSGATLRVGPYDYQVIIS